MFGQNKRLSNNDIKCIVLILDDFNNKHSELTSNQKEYFLANTLKEFGVNVDSTYSYGSIPPPPMLDNSYHIPYRTDLIE